MMYKQLCAFILAVCILSVSAIVPHAADSDQVEVTGDVLLVYDDEISQLAHKNVASISDILTFMGFKVCYRSIKESKGILKNFSHILYYHDSDKIEQDFLNELRNVNSKIMVVGGGAISDLLKTLHLPLNATSLESKVIHLGYSFDGEKEISMLVNAQRVGILKGNLPYSSGTILADGQSGSYCARVGRFSNIAVYDSSNDLLKAMLTQQIALWKWPFDDAPHSYAQYIIFDNVFPFFDTNKMMDVINMMKEIGIPYAITVMPIYQNGDYPAMKRFCEVLRYAQANGAAIVLKAPTINTDKPIEKDINSNINTAFSCYYGFGVYPIALEAPKNWIYEKLGQSVLRRFRTIVLTLDDKESSWSQTDKYNTIYADGHQIIPPALTNGNSSASLISTHSSAVFLNMLSSLDDLRIQLQRIQESNIPLMSLWSSSHSVYTDDKVLSYKDNILNIQGKMVSMEFIPSEYNENYQYNRGIIGRMAKSFESENRKLLVVVCTISVIFLLFIVIARYQNRKKLFYKSDESKGC